jgi:hypothetical protein
MKQLLKEIHMQARALFWFHSVAALGFGLAFLAFPGFMSDFLAVPTDTMGTIGWRLLRPQPVSFLRAEEPGCGSRKLAQSLCRLGLKNLEKVPKNGIFV